MDKTRECSKSTFFVYENGRQQLLSVQSINTESFFNKGVNQIFQIKDPVSELYLKLCKVFYAQHVSKHLNCFQGFLWFLKKYSIVQIIIIYILLR